MNTIYYIAAYYTSKIDLHKNTQLTPNDFNYIKEYYNSIVNNNLHAIIFHDECNNNFINKYQTDKIQFVKSITDHHMQPHDFRFIEFYNYLLSHNEIKYVCFTDISDVIIIKDCEIITIKDNLFVGIENDNINDNKWFNEYLNHLNIKHSLNFLNNKYFKSTIILNCGVVCGNRYIVLDFLNKCKKIFILLYSKYKIERPLDMFIINYVGHAYFENKLYDKNDFVTPFGHYINNDSYYIKHK